MSEPVMEISEDYDTDDVPEKDILVEEKSESSQWNEIEQLEVSIHQLTRCTDLVNFHGLNSSSLGILKAHNLLMGSSLETIALESVRHEDTSIAVEALSDNAKTKIAEWSAKVLVFIKNTFNKATDLVTTIKNKIVNNAKIISEKSSELFDKGVAYAKAHPYKTILGVLAAAALVLGVVKFAAVASPGANCLGSQLKSYMDKIRQSIQSIKPAFGKITTTSVGEAGVVNISVESTTLVTTTEKLGVLGWTKSSFLNIVKQIEGLWDKFSSTMKPFYDKFIKPIDNVISNVGFFPKVVADKVKNSTGSRALPWLTEKVVASVYYPIMIKLFKSLWELLKAFVIKAFEVVNTTFTGLKNSKQEAAA